MKNIFLLGATGSIGTQTLEVLKNATQFQLIGVSLGSDHEKNNSILSQFNPKIASIRDEKHLNNYQSKFPNIAFYCGDTGLIEIARFPLEGLLINALSGSAGLKPTVEAIKSKKDILLANKETLVMAGEHIKKLIKLYKVNLFPIDSEHSAIWQTLEGEPKDHILKIVITASGGSFRSLSREALMNVTIEQALNHPNWKMGSKITIDSATMMNKGLEVIEAHHLFDIPYDCIETILHPESQVHGLTYFKNGMIKASIGSSDMRMPISYALHYPERHIFDHQPLVLEQLTFKPMDFKRFPLLELAYEVGKKGGIYPTVMNAANEAAVKLFLNHFVSFLDIEKIVLETVKDYPFISDPTIDQIIEVDQEIQQQIFKHYEKR